MVGQSSVYSWHPNTRGPQVYRLWASDGADPKFKGQPKGDIDPATVGWKLIAVVDTRVKEGEEGGQYGVSVADCALAAPVDLPSNSPRHSEGQELSRFLTHSSSHRALARLVDEGLSFAWPEGD
jgi:hypothetical protein